ncbi:MAG TPA: hypothetical protein DCP63_04010, partial [Bacteroidetes bacterium]|nr:hypothetical protein [Bacteroidota bacterium]
MEWCGELRIPPNVVIGSELVKARESFGGRGESEPLFDLFGHASIRNELWPPAGAITTEARLYGVWLLLALSFTSPPISWAKEDNSVALAGWVSPNDGRDEVEASSEWQPPCGLQLRSSRLRS